MFVGWLIGSLAHWLIGLLVGWLVGEAMARSWQIDQHAKSPKCVRQVVATMMLVRSVAHEPKCVLWLMPNELMFHIFGMLSAA
jgi:hypothetical protein